MSKSLKPYIIIDSANGILEVSLSYVIHQDEGWFFAECPELHQMDQGKTQREAIENLLEMVKAVLLEAFESAKLDAMLMELGFKKSSIHQRKEYKSSIKKFEDMHPLKLNVRLPYSSKMIAVR
jgi:predicted RNase H-like HicB family nuclease